MDILDTSHLTTNLYTSYLHSKAQYGKNFRAQIMKLHVGVGVWIHECLRTKKGNWLASQPTRFIFAFSYLELFHRYRLTNGWAPRRYANAWSTFNPQRNFPYVLRI
jgi:hypothetical protein